jgi:hypothetical protein
MRMGSWYTREGEGGRIQRELKICIKKGKTTTVKYGKRKEKMSRESLLWPLYLNS